MTGWSPHRRARAGIARTFQHNRSFRGLTVRENVEVAALGAGSRPAEARALADGLLSVLGLDGDALAGELSHGDERLLGVARAVATQPAFVLLDEPAAGLSEAEVPAFAGVVRSIRDDHDAGVLLIDHNMALVMEVCDRIHVLDQGRTLAEGSPAEIRGEPRRHLGLPRRERGRGRVTTSPMLELDELVVRYGSVPAVRGLNLARGARRARRPDRPQRRRQVDDAARDHGRRPRGGGRRPLRRPVDPRARSGGDRPRRDLARAGGTADLRGALRRGEPAARARGPPPQRRRADPLAAAFELFPMLAEIRAPSGGRALGRPAAAARDRARARRRSGRAPARRAFARALADRRRRGLRGARGDPRAGRHRSCSSSSARSAPSRSPTARSCSPTGSCG